MPTFHVYPAGELHTAVHHYPEIAVAASSNFGLATFKTHFGPESSPLSLRLALQPMHYQMLGKEHLKLNIVTQLVESQTSGRAFPPCSDDSHPHETETDRFNCWHSIFVEAPRTELVRAFEQSLGPRLVTIADGKPFTGTDKPGHPAMAHSVIDQAVQTALVDGLEAFHREWRTREGAPSVIISGFPARHNKNYSFQCPTFGKTHPDLRLVTPDAAAHHTADSRASASLPSRYVVLTSSKGPTAWDASSRKRAPTPQQASMLSRKPVMISTYDWTSWLVDRRNSTDRQVGAKQAD